MDKYGKPFGFRLPLDMAIEVKVSAVRKQQALQDWFVDATKLKLKLEEIARSKLASNQEAQQIAQV